MTTLKTLHFTLGLLAIVGTQSARSQEIDPDQLSELVALPGTTVGNEDSDFDSGVRLHTPTFAGNGCPSESVAAVLSPDNKSLSLLFDGFQVEANSAIPVATKRCFVRVPFTVPVGYRAAIVRSDVRGFNSLPLNTNSSLRVQYAFEGLPVATPKLTAFKHFVGPQEAGYTLGAAFDGEGQWTGCGGSFAIGIDVNLSAQSGAGQGAALTTVDSIDGTLRDALISHILWKRCEAGGVRPPRKPKKDAETVKRALKFSLKGASAELKCTQGRRIKEADYSGTSEKCQIRKNGDKATFSCSAKAGSCLGDKPRVTVGRAQSGTCDAKIWIKCQ